MFIIMLLVSSYIIVAADGNDGGHGIIVIDREVVEINYFLLYFIDSAKPFDSGLVQPLAKRKGFGRKREDGEKNVHGDGGDRVTGSTTIFDV